MNSQSVQLASSGMLREMEDGKCRVEDGERRKEEQKKKEKERKKERKKAKCESLLSSVQLMMSSLSLSLHRFLSLFRSSPTHARKKERKKLCAQNIRYNTHILSCKQPDTGPRE